MDYIVLIQSIIYHDEILISNAQNILSFIRDIGLLSSHII